MMESKRKEIIRVILTAAEENQPQLAVPWIDENVVLYLDQFKGQGYKSWKNWIRYLHTQTGSTSKVQIDQFKDSSEENKVIVYGRLECEDLNGMIRSNPIQVEYFFKENRVVKIKSKRSNYISILGNYFDTFPGFIFHIAKYYLYLMRGKLK